MRKRVTAWLAVVILIMTSVCPVLAASVPQEETPDYKVAFYAFDNYHMQDENGRRTGYGYEMMQGISKYMQCTFSYVGYEKSAAECVEMLRNGELDIYTAAKVTPEREAEFAISTHPAITATTSMNVKVGNTKVVAGDYETYNGLRIGLLSRHTYNQKVLDFLEEKNVSCDIIYYETPTELTNALINDEVDALVNSYIRTPEDEAVVEDFGQTPYYIMARKEDQALIDEIDAAIDSMNVETPNWRTELYNKYYGSQELNTELTQEEQVLLAKMQEDGTVIRGVMDPDGAPYSWYEDGEAYGIAADIFRATARALGLDYEIVPVADRFEYLEQLASGGIDVWMDVDGYLEQESESNQYKTTNPYLTTTVSVLRMRSTTDKMHRLAVIDSGIMAKEIADATWSDVKLVSAKDTKQCMELIQSGKVDGALMMTYTAQSLARADVQNRFRVDIVPGATIGLQMAVNASDDRDFYGIWEKTLANVAARLSAEVVQSYVETTETPTFVAYLFEHPIYFAAMCVAAVLFVCMAVLYGQSVRSRRRQQKISGELAAALEEAKRANDAKQNFFSKMSHDIRTPLNVVLGMTQIAQKYKQDTGRLEAALDSITSEGNYLLVLINSILDVNQLEHGHVELRKEAFAPEASLNSSVEILRPLAEKKEQTMKVYCAVKDRVVVGDPNRFSQIMINIISNAIKYTNAGGTIEISLGCQPDGQMRFCCRDNGIGMTEEFLKHITEDFVRAEDSRVSKTQGTGLGMSVVKGFTDLMHGTLTVESKLGVGSVFTVDIPFEEATEEQREAVLNQEQEPECVIAQFTDKKVLLAEDNALNAEIAIELLSTLGFSVDWAENGFLAAEKYRASREGEYFAIFMDMQMPVMDGLESTRVIRNSDREDRTIPIFAMTANTFASDRKRCEDAGMTGYIAKPINLDAITVALKEVMKDLQAVS